ITHDGLNFLIAYQGKDNSSQTQIKIARVSGQGVALDPSGLPVTLNSTPNKGAPVVAFDGQDCLVAWPVRAIPPVGNGSIYGTWVTEAGDILTPNGMLLVGQGGLVDYTTPALAGDGAGHLLLAYSRGDTSPTLGSYRVKARLITSPLPLG